jgi:hypothetical protein
MCRTRDVPYRSTSWTFWTPLRGRARPGRGPGREQPPDRRGDPSPVRQVQNSQTRTGSVSPPRRSTPPSAPGATPRGSAVIKNRGSTKGVHPRPQTDKQWGAAPPHAFRRPPPGAPTGPAADRASRRQTLGSGSAARPFSDNRALSPGSDLEQGRHHHRHDDRRYDRRYGRSYARRYGRHLDPRRKLTTAGHAPVFAW